MRLVELQAVTCRDDAGPKGASRGLLSGVSLSLEAGAVAVLGAPEDGTLALVDALTGRRPVGRGVVRVAGAEPHRSAACRARIGALSINPCLPPAPTALASVALASRPRGLRAEDVLAAEGLAGLAARPFPSLTRAELRALEFALAVTTPSAALVVLTEPFSDLAGVPERAVHAAIDRLAASAAVIVVTASPRDAQRLPRVLALRRGVLVRETAGDHAALALKDAVQMSVWLSHGARRFASTLAASSAVDGAVLDVHARGEVDAGVVRVTGRSAEELSLEIARAASEGDVGVLGACEVPPQLLDVQAASDWEVRQRAMTLAMMRPPSGPMGPHVPFGSALPYGAPMASPGFVRAPAPRSVPPSASAPPSAPAPAPQPPSGLDPPVVTPASADEAPPHAAPHAAPPAGAPPSPPEGGSPPDRGGPA